MLCDHDIFKKGLTRKEFLKAALIQGMVLIGFSFPCRYIVSESAVAFERAESDKLSDLIEALYYKKLDGGDVQCELCPHQCVVTPGHRGACGVRENEKGIYIALTYNKPCSLYVDPIEKKPLFHVIPGAEVYSLATAGCNLRCQFCQNWQISQALPEEVHTIKVTPQEILQEVKDRGLKLIAYTYSEPTIFYEYMFDIAKKAHEAGLMNTCHSNGFINPEPLSRLLVFMDAVNIDLKGFTEEYYHEICGGELKPVLDRLKQIKRSKTHLEITHLIIPGKNDQPEQIRSMCKWIKNELGSDVPLHFSRFYPRYKLKNAPPTPKDTLSHARLMAMEEGLDFVYIGNLEPGHEAENTFCSNCHKIIIERRGYSVKRIELKDGKCGYCGQKIPGIWG